MSLADVLAAMVDAANAGFSLLATPEGRALAALVEAAVTWRGMGDFDAMTDGWSGLDAAVDAYLALAEPRT